MRRLRTYVSKSVAVCAWLSMACGSAAGNLRPEQLAKNEGAIFGHIELVDVTEDVTSKCYVEFTDTEQNRKAYLSLDGTGWIFTSVKPGTTFLSRFLCTLGGILPYTVSYDFRNLEFDVPGDRRIAYFGHVRVSMRSAGPGDAIAGPVVGSVIGGAVGGFVSAEMTMHRSETGVPLGLREVPDVYVEDHFDQAKREYEIRYNRGAKSLEPVTKIAQRPPPPIELAGDRAPASFLGFALDKDVSVSESSCAGAGFAWRKLDDAQQFECSGVPADREIPKSVTLGACATGVCEVIVDGNPDHAAWKTLTSRFIKLSELLEKSLGARSQRKTEALDDCTQGIQACFAKGRARTDRRWVWGDKKSAVLTLDGGPSNEAPSLVIRFGAARAKKH